MLLAVSNHVIQNIASIPFLWIPPLALYLLSFILCFDHDGWYRPRVVLVLLIVALPGMGWLLDSLDLKYAIPSYLAGLFLVCMFCHCEVARLSLEREPPQQFDLLAIDAFSGDAIPTHLLSAEAMDLYLRHVRPDGAILFHVTNRYLELAPVVARIAESRGLRVGVIEHEPNDEEEDLYHSISDWVVVTRNAALLTDPAVAEILKTVNIGESTPLWTDDFNNLVRVLK